MAIKSSNQITFTEHKKIVQIKEWYLATSKSAGVTKDPSEGWTTTMQSIDEKKQYLWNYEEVIYSIGSSDISDPVIIGFYGKGDAGRGVEDIKNFYQVTQNLVAPELPGSNGESGWGDVSVVKQLSPINKYLWNYESIIYTDGTTKQTDPAIIGVYGDSGTNAITFEIYSVHGFMFKENLKSIELKIAAFDGANAITNATYTWSWWDSTLNDGAGGYKTIVENTSELSFTINESDVYAFANLKCAMNYDGGSYEDYVVLTREAVIYTAVVKFPDGKNVFYADDLYLIAYVDLYQNNHIVESPFTSISGYYKNLSTIDSFETISTNMAGNFNDGDKTYFVCKNGDVYDVVLGQYTSGTWKKINNETKYRYDNTLYANINSNILAISKESINKSANITFKIWHDEEQITEAYTNVVDSNDPIVGDNEPKSPVVNQLWLNTKTNPPVLKMCNGFDENGSPVWINCSQKVGGNVHTSKPNLYSEGDLWILANGESCTNSHGSFGAGSMLKATASSNGEFVAYHWIDADVEMTSLKNNVNQYFDFNTVDGLTIGQSDKAFHVNITSQKMGFSHGDNEVVHIGYNSANIDNLTAEGDLNVDEGDVAIKKTVNSTKYSFKWQIEESNGSFSLVKQ